MWVCWPICQDLLTFFVCLWSSWLYSPIYCSIFAQGYYILWYILSYGSRINHNLRTIVPNCMRPYVISIFFKAKGLYWFVVNFRSSFKLVSILLPVSLLVWVAYLISCICVIVVFTSLLSDIRYIYVRLIVVLSALWSLSLSVHFISVSSVEYGSPNIPLSLH